MKIAIVHELLTVRGGAERVARVFADMFPDAPVYTLLYNEVKLGEWFPASRVRTSSLQRFARFSTNHHLYLSAFPRAVEAWDFSEFDLILSSSSAFAHGIMSNGKPRHLCYVHSPARYLWDSTHEVQERAGEGIAGPLRQAYLRRILPALRVWDTETASRPDYLLANSTEVQRRIQQYWRRDSTILYPPVDDFWFEPGQKKTDTGTPYFLIVSTLARYKCIDIAILACNKLRKTLHIVGEGPDAARLQSLAGPTIHFHGRLPNEDVRSMYASADAVLFPGHDDFGLVPVEAMASGTPVIAYRAGGATETVADGTTGLFFSQPSADSLAETLTHFKKSDFDKHACTNHAKQFSRQRFEDGIHRHIEKMMN
ncbi:MAG: glycosyl transferase group 1 [Candidatus Peribacteria bacterium]|nr:glycosyl transferase group 1 [Candidatus Peribacteria bacterium]